MRATNRRLLTFIGLHLLVSAGVSEVFAWRYSHNALAAGAHVLLLAEWDLALVALFRVFTAQASQARWPLMALRTLMTLTCTPQV